ncbi:MAG: hypothetical protein D6743_13060 [Calditrichaeota bacterium]|nr:MAG: hypothetical protein D6743_13060 [Calditrichota bacterium]
MIKFFRRKKGKRKRGRGKPAAASFYEQMLLLPAAGQEIKHPTSEIWLTRQLEKLCQKRLSTQMVGLLERLVALSDGPVTRSMLLKKALKLRKDYLDSFKEYSDRALILLTQREKRFDKWEGIHILGCFGKEGARKYLQERAEAEPDPLLKAAMFHAAEKITSNLERRKRERGF